MFFLDMENLIDSVRLRQQGAFLTIMSSLLFGWDIFHQFVSQPEKFHLPVK